MLFDTSAIIGMLERRSPTGRALIDAATALPRCHFVSLGEISAGVRRAETSSDDTGLVASRRSTLEFAERMPACPMPSASDVACFGVIVANTTRKLSHNDQWILASAIVHGLTLVTEDERLHDAAVDPVLRDAVTSLLGLPQIESTLI